MMNPDPYQSLWEAACGTGLALLIVATFPLLRWLYRSWKCYRYYDSARLFSALCRVHRLNKKERKLLHDAAVAWQLDDPSSLFIDRGLWKSEVEPYRSLARRILESSPTSTRSGS